MARKRSSARPPGRTRTTSRRSRAYTCPATPDQRARAPRVRARRRRWPAAAPPRPGTAARARRSTRSSDSQRPYSSPWKSIGTPPRCAGARRRWDRDVEHGGMRHPVEPDAHRVHPSAGNGTPGCWCRFAVEIRGSGRAARRAPRAPERRRRSDGGRAAHVTGGVRRRSACCSPAPHRRSPAHRLDREAVARPGSRGIST